MHPASWGQAVCPANDRSPKGCVLQNRFEVSHKIAFFLLIIIDQRKGSENEAFSEWNPQAETAFFAEENRLSPSGTDLFILLPFNSKS